MKLYDNRTNNLEYKTIGFFFCVSRPRNVRKKTGLRSILIKHRYKPVTFIAFTFILLS